MRLKSNHTQAFLNCSNEYNPFHALEGRYYRGSPDEVAGGGKCLGQGHRATASQDWDLKPAASGPQIYILAPLHRPGVTEHKCLFSVEVHFVKCCSLRVCLAKFSGFHLPPPLFWTFWLYPNLDQRNWEVMKVEYLQIAASYETQNLIYQRF